MSTVAPSRRSALRLAGGAALTGTAAATLGAAPADAADQLGRVGYRPGRFSSTPILGVQARHLVNRFSYGITPSLVAEVRAAGGHLAWFDRQLATAYDGTADDLCDWWPDLRRAPTDLWSRNTGGIRGGWEVMYDYGSRVLSRRLVSPRQVLEVMTEFWENHFHVPSTSDNVFPVRVDYGEVIRARALGRFDDLLQAAVLHPAMLLYLGAASSTKTHPNENLGRELLELHTVGLGHYSEDDVKGSARILTGHGTDAYGTWQETYKPANHWTGPVQVMGFSDPNGAADGRSVTAAYLSYLAHHPATAQRVASKLAKAFVSDTPSSGLVDRLARVYLANDTAITPVLRALVRDPEFKSAVDAKVRDADEDVLAAYRVLGIQVRPPRSDASAANQLYWQAAMIGLEPFTWPRPDGQPVHAAAWSSPSRALASMTFHWDVVNGWWPGDAVRFPTPASWVPRRPRRGRRGRELTFRQLVDHLSRRILHRPSTPSLLKACCTVAGVRPGDRVGPGSPVVRSRMPLVLATVMDSPAFYQH